MGILREITEAAEATPAHRNRAADFWRATAILFVISGHWLLVAPYMGPDGLELGNMLAISPWTHYATWIFQVMPVFFIVGGYANAASLRSAQDDAERKQSWQARRLNRLLVPLVPLVLFWAVGGAIAASLGLGPELLAKASQAALVPAWFLAVYMLVTIVAPVTLAIWTRTGLWSVAGLVFCASIVDFVAFSYGAGWLRWANYGFVWLAMHQVGYYWADRSPGRSSALFLLCAGIAGLWLIVGPLGYPASMVSVPGQEISNTRPPTVAMLVMGFAQAGLVFLLEGKVNTWLLRRAPWMAVILVSRYIMTIYLWHITALVMLMGISLLFGGFGMTTAPGSMAWWLARPPVFAALALVLLAFAGVFSRFESRSRNSGRGLPGPGQVLIGAVIACSGLVDLTLNGIAGRNLLGVNWLSASVVIIGVAIATISLRGRAQD